MKVGVEKRDFGDKVGSRKGFLESRSQRQKGERDTSGHQKLHKACVSVQWTLDARVERFMG